MTYKTCSVNKVLAQIYRDFKPSNSSWTEDAIEWIADAIEIMKCYQGYAELSKTVETVDYRAKLPCDLEMLLGIEYKGKRLQKSGGINHKFKKCSCLDNLVCEVQESYSLNPNYIHTTFKKECITIYYLGLEVDCDGFPLIIDDAIYREALTWYVLMKMCLRGFKHQTINFEFCRKEWERYYPKAQNRCRMPDIDSYEVFKKSWMGLARSTNMTNEFFNTVVSGGGVNSNTSKPGDLVQSFQILGNNLNNV